MKEGWEYKKLGELCAFDKRFNGLEKGTQKRILSYIHVSAEKLKSLKSHEGNVRLLSTGYFDGVTTLEKAEDIVNYGEVICFPSGGSANLKYYKGEFVDSGNILMSSISPDINLRFVFHYLLSINTLIDSFYKGVSIKHPYMPDVYNLFIPIPSLQEQEVILSHIDSSFAKIDTMKANAEKALNEAKALFQASLNEMLEPKEGWEEKKLEDITEVKDGTHDSPKYVTEGIPFVTQKNITINGFDLLNTKKITLEDHKKFYTRSNVEFGDIIISMIGANRGMSCIVDSQEIFSIKNVGLIKKSDSINTRFLLFYLHSTAANAYVLDNSNGGAQEFIGLKGLRNFPVPYPHLSEQQSIVATLDSLKSKVDRLHENYDKISQECDALKQAILRQVFE